MYSDQSACVIHTLIEERRKLCGVLLQFLELACSVAYTRSGKYSCPVTIWSSDVALGRVGMSTRQAMPKNHTPNGRGVLIGVRE